MGIMVFPITTTNKNVPADALLLADHYVEDGDYILSYFADKNGRVFEVDNWLILGNWPIISSLNRIVKLTGISADALQKRIKSELNRE